MIKLFRTDANHLDFKVLVKQLDAYLKITDGNEHEFYNQFNAITHLKHVIIVYANNIPVGCGAFKVIDASQIEIKRMFTLAEYRGKGIASKILSDLEKWASELNYNRAILETGIRQIEAVELYKRKGYNITPNYGQYKNVVSSICFEKLLKNEKG